ncbi:MAG: hypothetical protein K0S04_1912 [Herbinix sp.]|jgi:hypothetical protein|nr:hypothetical protein [Herbinix sp.]
MKALKFLKVDWLRCKSQLRVMAILPLIAIALVFGGMDNELFINAYVVFGAIIFSTQPFTMESASESGFINMLPGTKRDRVTGRYLFALALTLFSVLVGVIAVSIYDIYKDTSLEPVMSVSCILFGCAMVICSLQYVLFYSIGKGKSNQMMAIIRMIPSFVMFFLGTYLSDWIKSGDGTNLEWVLEREVELSLLCVLVGLFVFFVGISVSSRIIEHKDFA